MTDNREGDAETILSRARALISSGAPELAVDLLESSLDTAEARRLHREASFLAATKKPLLSSTRIGQRILRLPNFRSAEIQSAGAQTIDIFDSVSETLPPPKPDYRTVYTICITPRSGSTYLARAMSELGVFGHPQEYLHRLEPTALTDHAKLFGASSWDTYVAALAARTSSDNRVFGVKADPDMLLPLLIDGAFDRTLRHGKFIYITRADLVMQAISLTKAQHTGAWTEQVKPRAAPEFSFAAIHANVRRLAEMMGRWEAFFALNGISPLRLTYERIDSDVTEVLSEIAGFLGVSLPASATTQTKSHRAISHQRNQESSSWRTRFLTALNIGGSSNG